MKKIEDYLHLYLGCEVRTNDTAMDTILRGRTGTFVGFTDESRTSVIMKFRAGPDGRAGLWNIKPLLRPLSDMTEQEAIEFCCLHYTIQNTIKYASWDDGRDTRYGKPRVYFETTGFKQSGSIPLDKLMPEGFVYLLSKHFDLFRLIEDGLAIDSTKINEPA